MASGVMYMFAFLFFALSVISLDNKGRGSAMCFGITVFLIVMGTVIDRIEKLIEATNMLDPDYKAKVKAERAAEAEQQRQEESNEQDYDQLMAKIAKKVTDSLTPAQQAALGKVEPVENDELPEIKPEDLDKMIENAQANRKQGLTEKTSVKRPNLNDTL